MKSAVLFIAFVFAAGCASVSAKKVSVDKILNFASLQGKNLQLVSVKSEDGAAIFDKAKLDAEKFSDVYTIMFAADRAAGKASPNRYTATYKINGDNISFGAAAGTRMLGIYTPEGLNENEYYKLLENAKTWSLSEEGLAIKSSNAYGTGVVLLFSEIK